MPDEDIQDRPAAPVGPSEPPHGPATSRVTFRALALGDRIEIAGLERSDMISALPLAFNAGHGGRVALFRFGIVVLAGLSPLEEDEIVSQLAARVSGARGATEDDETDEFEIGPGFDDRIGAQGRFLLKDMSDARFLVIADALAKNVALSRDERRIGAVFETIEPFAALLAQEGKIPGDRRALLKLIGQALQAQHRMAGRIGVEEKPDILWDRPDLERLHTRLNDEYELDERGQILKRKLEVVAETARSLTDVIDVNHSTRLEWIVILLISFEVLFSLVNILVLGRH